MQILATIIFLAYVDGKFSKFNSNELDAQIKS
jgi:hypothetical protein